VNSPHHCVGRLLAGDYELLRSPPPWDRQGTGELCETVAGLQTTRQLALRDRIESGIPA
jgi:hypothetical protein